MTSSELSVIEVAEERTGGTLGSKAVEIQSPVQQRMKTVEKLADS